MSSLNLIALDTETGGLMAGRHPLIEVAYAPIFSDDPLTVLWNGDFRVEDCDPQALKINGCAERGPAPDSEVLSQSELARRLAKDLKGKVIVAANPQFDASHMAALLVNEGLIKAPAEGMVSLLQLDAPWSYRLIDLKSLAVGYLAALGALPKMPAAGWGQRDVADVLPVPTIPKHLRHTAAGDVTQLRAVVRMLLGESSPELKR